jgi:hypothetical protein
MPFSECVQPIKQPGNIGRVVEYVGVEAQERGACICPHVDCLFTQERNDPIARRNR